MESKKYLFRKLYNIYVEKAYLHKKNATVLGLYRNNQLIGCLQEVGSSFSVAQLAEQIEEIFPLNFSDLAHFKTKKHTISYSNDVLGKKLHLSQKDNYDYFDANDNYVAKSNSTNFFNKNLWKIEPIAVYLQKSDSYMSALYLHHFLVGCFAFEGSQVSVKKFAPYIETIFPTNLNDLDFFMKKNTALTYYVSTDIVYYNEKQVLLMKETAS